MRRRILRVAIAPLAPVPASLATTPAATADRVLRVGTYHGIPGQYRDVQAAINAAAPNDWILVAPGDYHEVKTLKPAGAQGDDAHLDAGLLLE